MNAAFAPSASVVVLSGGGRVGHCGIRFVDSCVRIHGRPSKPDDNQPAIRSLSIADARHDAIVRSMFGKTIDKNLGHNGRFVKVVRHDDPPQANASPSAHGLDYAPSLEPFQGINFLDAALLAEPGERLSSSIVVAEDHPHPIAEYHDQSPVVVSR